MAGTRLPLHASVLLALASAQIRIQAPEALVEEFPITHGVVYGTTATFGAPYYGERVLGQLLYGETRGKDHCSDADYVLPPVVEDTSQENTGQKLVNVVLVRRGQCTFVTKVRVAAGKGAHAVIVVDKETSTMTSEQIQHIVMADDGTGDDIQIPSILISTEDGQKLVEAAQRGMVIVELAWDIPQGEVVVADFWMSSGSRESVEFLDRFKLSAEVLKYHLQFVPHYHIFQLNGGRNALCFDEEGRYCAPRPDVPDGQVTGADVVGEDLRQLCIWNVTARTAPGNPEGATYSQQFWDYIERFTSQCSLKAASVEDRFGETCSMTVMEQLGIPTAEVLRCTDNNRETFLDEQIQNVAWSPQALRLNGWRYSGPLDPETVLKAVCSGYAVPPVECRKLLQGYTGVFRWVSGGLTYGTFAWSIVLMALFFMGVFWLYKRHVTSSVRKVLREEVMLEVQTQMADYAPLQDGGEQRSQRVLSF